MVIREDNLLCMIVTIYGTLIDSITTKGFQNNRYFLSS